MTKLKAHSPIQTDTESALSLMNSKQMTSLTQKLSSLVQPETEISLDPESLLSKSVEPMKA